jgi:hypothetical protein
MDEAKEWASPSIFLLQEMVTGYRHFGCQRRACRCIEAIVRYDHAPSVLATAGEWNPPGDYVTSKPFPRNHWPFFCKGTTKSKPGAGKEGDGYA